MPVKRRKVDKSDDKSAKKNKKAPKTPETPGQKKKLRKRVQIEYEIESEHLPAQRQRSYK